MSASILELAAERRAQLAESGTNAFRILDGTEWEGVFVDVMADRYLVSLRDCDMPPSLMDMLSSTGSPIFLKHLDRDNKQAPAQIAGPSVENQFIIQENGVSYIMDMAAGYSQGLFLDQRDNRREVMDRCREGMTLLNTFSYTGGFSLCAALAGAQTTTLDLARPCLDWCKQNMQLNNIDPAAHYFCKGDTLHWLERFSRQKRRFDGIILDPPTFSRDEKGRIWRAERDYGMLVSMALSCLSNDGWILCTSNCRKMSHQDFAEMVSEAAPQHQLQHALMPFDFDGEDYLKCLWVEPRNF